MSDDIDTSLDREIQMPNDLSIGTGTWNASASRKVFAALCSSSSVLKVIGSRPPIQWILQTQHLPKDVCGLGISFSFTRS